ncbi:MAG: hypothetical protein CM1200mP2_14200 [Planctomycetaceae bacterium]|nr:MAG: hypothetical protein CM1200mP2_14200 [Planctomycetaceae bacterium]
MSQSRHQLSAAGLPCCSRRSFLQWSTVAGLPVVLGNAGAVAGDVSRQDVPAGIDLESLRQDIGDGPEVLVSRAVAAGWRVVCDETVLKRPEAWQRDLAVALERNRVELSAIEAVVDFGRVTFASSSPVVRRGVMRRLEGAMGRARRLRCRHLLVVPGLMPSGEPPGAVGRRVADLLGECRMRAARAGMRIVVERIERRSDQVRLAGDGDRNDA